MEVIYKGNTLWYKNNGVEVGNSVIIKQFFELIEEDEIEIDIDSMKKIDYNDRFYRTDNIDKINELVQAVKRLNKEIKSIKAYKEIKEIEESHRKENGKLRERVKGLEEENEDLKNIANNKQWISPCYVAQNYISKSKIKENIEELNKRIDYLKIELNKCYIEREKLGTETDIDNNETAIFYMEEEKDYIYK